MNKEIIRSKAKHLVDTDLDMYQMTFFDCNSEVPIIGEVFYIKMGGVKYEVTDEEFVHESGGNEFKYVVKHNGVVLDGLLFDIDVEAAGKKLDETTVGQLVGLKDNSKQFRSAHRDRVKKLTSPKKKRTVKKSAGGSAVSPA